MDQSNYGFVDSYNCRISIENDGMVWTENHNNISLSDFEILYGNIIGIILYVKLELIIDNKR